MQIERFSPFQTQRFLCMSRIETDKQKTDMKALPPIVQHPLTANIFSVTQLVYLFLYNAILTQYIIHWSVLKYCNKWTHFPFIYIQHKKSRKGSSTNGNCILNFKWQLPSNIYHRGYRVNVFFTCKLVIHLSVEKSDLKSEQPDIHLLPGLLLTLISDLWLSV